MKLNDLRPAKGAKKTRRRVGRGLGSGRGKTAGRGQKGQSSRSGFSQRAGWEGGRSQLIARLPKRGFTGRGFEYQIVNLVDLERFEEGGLVTVETLHEVGLVRHLDKPVKLLGNGELTVKGLNVELTAYSASAVKAIEGSGGRVSRQEQDPAEGPDQSDAQTAAAAPVQEPQQEQIIQQDQAAQQDQDIQQDQGIQQDWGAEQGEVTQQDQGAEQESAVQEHTLEDGGQDGEDAEEPA